MRVLSLLEVPFSGTQSILNFFDTHSQEVSVPQLNRPNGVQLNERKHNLIKQSINDFHSVSHPCEYQQKGIFFTEPALRLARAYVALSKTQQSEISFESFYRDKNRQNLYSNMLQSVSIDELGVVGVDKYVNLSILLISEYLVVSKPLEWTFLNPHDKEAYSYLTDKTLKDIRRLNTKDYSLYENAIQQVKQQYSNLVEPVTKTLPKEKRIFIHVGPSKTGSSAIQSMLHNQQQLLKEQQFYYPEHDIDRNAISSGNYAHVLSQKDQTNEYELDIQKCTKLMDDFKSVNHSTLILSSERFESCLFSLFRVFETATIIYYVRFPAAQFESGYHQQVKRHGRTSPFQLPDKLRLTNLELLLQLANELDRNVSIRFYDSAINSTNSLLEDFSDAIGFSMDNASKSERINARLDFQALELIRYCNQFLTRDEVSPLEQTLQSTSKRNSRFTLISPEQLESLNSILADDIETLIKRFAFIEQEEALVARFRALSKMRIDYPYFVQTEAGHSLNDAWLDLKSSHINIARDIYEKQLQRASSFEPVLSWSLIDSIRYYRHKLANFSLRFIGR